MLERILNGIHSLNLVFLKKVNKTDYENLIALHFKRVFIKMKAKR